MRAQQYSRRYTGTFSVTHFRGRAAAALPHLSACDHELRPRGAVSPSRLARARSAFADRSATRRHSSPQRCARPPGTLVMTGASCARVARHCEPPCQSGACPALHRRPLPISERSTHETGCDQCLTRRPRAHTFTLLSASPVIRRLRSSGATFALTPRGTESGQRKHQFERRAISTRKHAQAPPPPPPHARTHTSRTGQTSSS